MCIDFFLNGQPRFSKGFDVQGELHFSGIFCFEADRDGPAGPNQRPGSLDRLQFTEARKILKPGGFKVAKDLLGRYLDGS